MKFNLEEENKKKKKWKNGLSITPFIIHKDGGDVEKGIEAFNSAMNTGNPQGEVSGECQAMGEAIEAGQIDKAREIERDIQWYEEKEDDQPYNAGKYEAEISSLKQDLKENKMEFKHLHEVMKEANQTSSLSLMRKINKKFRELDPELWHYGTFATNGETNYHFWEKWQFDQALDYLRSLGLKVIGDVEGEHWDVNASWFNDQGWGRITIYEPKKVLDNKSEPIKEDAFQLDKDFSVEDLIGFVKVNAPYSREEEKPAAKECMINEINIPDNMRFNSWDIDAIGDDVLQLNWTTQEPFTSEDSEKFIAEIKRFFEALVRREEFHRPFTVALEVMSRSLDEDDGHLVYDIKINEMENEEMKPIKEDLNNVTEVEDKAKEVMDPAFASAVREIRSHDIGREELKKLRKAPKEGEESLPKDLKMNLDESLFTEWVEDENLNEHLFHAKPGVYVNTEDARDWIKIGHNGRIHSVSSGKIINDGFGTEVNGTKYIIDAREGGPDRLYVYSYDDNGVDEGFPFVFKFSNRKIEEDTELLNRIKSPISDDIELSADMKLRDAYTAYEPEEFQLDRLRNDITLKEVWEKMKAGEDIYELASVDGKGFDSAVREGIFVMLEMVLGVDYDTIYNTWLHPEMKESCSKKMTESEEEIHSVYDYLDSIMMGNGYVTVDKIEMDIEQAPYNFTAADVINHALEHSWKMKMLPDGLSLIQPAYMNEHEGE